VKVNTECEVCGKRAKRIPLSKELKLCMKHYRIKQEEKKEEEGKRGD